MAWIKELPGKPGWYGWRDNTAVAVVCCWFRKLGATECLVCQMPSSGTVTTPYTIGGEWWDEPLKLPWEGATA